MKERKQLKQGGFTLIEIIAVLVILGILAAVAIPRFQNLQQEARNSAAEGALAAGYSACSMEYARLLLADPANANAATIAANVGTGGNATPRLSGDLTLAFTANGNDINIDATSGPAGANQGTANGTWTLP